MRRPPPDLSRQAKDSIANETDRNTRRAFYEIILYTMNAPSQARPVDSDVLRNTLDLQETQPVVAAIIDSERFALAFYNADDHRIEWIDAVNPNDWLRTS